VIFLGFHLKLFSPAPSFMDRSSCKMIEYVATPFVFMKNHDRRVCMIFG